MSTLKDRELINKLKSGDSTNKLVPCRCLVSFDRYNAGEIAGFMLSELDGLGDKVQRLFKIQISKSDKKLGKAGSFLAVDRKTAEKLCNSGQAVKCEEV